jgi:hypothetical protein
MVNGISGDFLPALKVSSQHRNLAVSGISFAGLDSQNGIVRNASRGRDPAQIADVGLKLLTHKSKGVHIKTRADYSDDTQSRRIRLSLQGTNAYICDTQLDMRKSPARVIAENLAAAMLHHDLVTPHTGEPSQSALSRKSGADQRTIGRILHQDQSPTVDMLEKLATALDLHAWQLLIPNLDPKNPPVFILSKTERDFYRRIDELRAAEPPAHIYKVNSE